MIRYTSTPDVFVDVENGGRVTWEKFHSILEIDADHTVRYYRESLETSPGLYSPGYTPEPTILRGTVTSLVSGSSMTVRVKREDSDKTLTISVVAGQGELLGEVVSQFNDSRSGIILTPEATSGTLFPPPLPSKEAPLAAPGPGQTPPLTPAPPRSSPPPREPVMVLAPEAPASPEAFARQWARLNRHLRRHGGRAASLKKADLSGSQLAFLEALFSGPLGVLEQDALDDLRDFYAADPGRRVHVHVTSLTLPESQDGPWEIILGESAWAGAVVVYRLRGWAVLDRTLVG